MGDYLHGVEYQWVPSRLGGWCSGALCTGRFATTAWNWKELCWSTTQQHNPHQNRTVSPSRLPRKTQKKNVNYYVIYTIIIHCYTDFIVWTSFEMCFSWPGFSIRPQSIGHKGEGAFPMGISSNQQAGYTLQSFLMWLGFRPKMAWKLNFCWENHLGISIAMIDDQKASLVSREFDKDWLRLFVWGKS